MNFAVRRLLTKFRRQHSAGRYFLDFACAQAMLAIELDGTGHLLRTDEDIARDAHLASLGWLVLRFGNDAIVQKTDAVLETIVSELRRRLAPHPNPLPGG